MRAVAKAITIARIISSYFLRQFVHAAPMASATATTAIIRMLFALSSGAFREGPNVNGSMIKTNIAAINTRAQKKLRCMDPIFRTIQGTISNVMVQAQ